MNNWEKGGYKDEKTNDVEINPIGKKENLSVGQNKDEKNEQQKDVDSGKLEFVREQIKYLDDDKTDEKNNKDKIEKYINQHTPEYLKKEDPSTIYKFSKWVSSFFVKEIQGKDKLPEGPKLFIANHRGGESGRLIAALDNRVNISVAETINWKRNKAFQWVLKKLGMIPIKETFSNLSEQQIEEVLKKSPIGQKEKHKAVARGFNSLGGNTKNIKTMVALLLQGKDVAIFVEGPFSRLKEDERKAYAGFALVAREYKRVAGKELNIIPTGIRKSKVSFGESFHIDKKGKQSKEELQEIATEKIHGLYDALGE